MTNNITSKKQVKAYIIKLLLKVDAWILTGLTYVFNNLFKLTSFAMRSVGINMSSSRLKTKIITLILKANNLVSEKFLGNIGYGLMFTISKLLSIARIKITPKQLAINMLACVILGLQFADLLFENLIYAPLSLTINSLYKLNQNIRGKKMTQVATHQPAKTTPNKKLEQATNKIFKEYHTILKKYPEANIQEKFAIFISTTIKQNINSFGPIIEKHYLRKFKTEILAKEPSSNFAAQELLSIFSDENKFKGLVDFILSLANGLCAIRQKSWTHEESIRIFEHALAFVLEEIEQNNQPQLTEIIEDGVEILETPTGRDLAIEKLTRFFEEQKQYWHEQNQPYYVTGGYNLFRDHGFTGEEFASQILYNIKHRKQVPANEAFAEPEIKYIASHLGDPYERYPEDPILYAMDYIQITLGKVRRYIEAEGDHNGFHIIEADLMTPIAVMLLTHYVADHAHDPYTNKIPASGISLKTGSFTTPTLEGTNRPLSITLKQNAKQAVHTGVEYWGHAQTIATQTLSENKEKIAISGGALLGGVFTAITIGTGIGIAIGAGVGATVMAVLNILPATTAASENDQTALNANQPEAEEESLSSQPQVQMPAPSNSPSTPSWAQRSRRSNSSFDLDSTVMAVLNILPATTAASENDQAASNASQPEQESFSPPPQGEMPTPSNSPSTPSWAQRSRRSNSNFDLDSCDIEW
ncbi:hypothetical protein [Rickettsiales endosymbiont of Stachyamoeba lipophora]|uniref:hypothetical protein n=1 Tax=Rickettsiales endosymbiont of Stachyamoeba lipophora TaxID=2486578 RepID=UPI000F6559E5|nr:hypothetical protein [Rickettsiales endosymbiont of Stachyamoeba lipophora]AZL16435.1 hypothetical protein EF513_07885 [Rickettsiales endosymbiont of Stachyamoeba lipophora]